MSWDNLNFLELAAIRRLLMMDVADAAQCIGKVSNRTWQHWETGRNKVPHDVEEELYALFSQRQECIDGVIKSTKPHEALAIPFFRQYEDFEALFSGANKVWWRVYQSVAAFLFTELSYSLDDSATIDRASYLYQFFSRTRQEDLEYARMERVLDSKGK